MQSDPRVMPHSLEAERSVLGCMLIDGEAAYLAQESLAPEDFYSAAHREFTAPCRRFMRRASPSIW
jgi:replicative DNA helicase